MEKKLKYVKMPSWFYPKKIPTWSLKWFAYFAVLYFILWIPLPITYTKDIYIGPFGVPLFILGWTIINVLVILGLFAFYHEAKKVGFYDDENLGKNNGGAN